MTIKKISLLLAILLCLGLVDARAQATNSTAATLAALVRQVQAKVDAGKLNEADFADEIKSFDNLIAGENGAKTDEAAQIAYLKARLYLEVFNEPVQAQELFKRLEKEFPDSEFGKNAGRIAAQLDEPATLQKNRESLAVGKMFPDFEVKDLAGKPLSVAQYKGKVVLIDFWATWCPPCVRELPNTLEVYKKYHDQGFEIIGISLDDDQSELEAMLKNKNITWQQYFDGQGRENKLAVRYGADSPPAFYLLDRSGKIIGMDRYPDTVGKMRGKDLEKAVADALAEK